MPRYNCEYCNNEFSAKSNLNRHQKQAKYCLELQGVEPAIKDKILCDCGKAFTRKDNLRRHQQKCEYIEPTESKTMMKVMDKVLDTLKEVVKTPTQTTVNNNTQNKHVYNIIPITNEDLQKVLDYLDIETILRGGKGYANLATEKIFNSSNLLCTDQSRKKLRYKEENGEMVEDLGGKKITKKFFTAIGPKNKEVIDNEYENVREEFDEIKDGLRDGDMVKVLNHSIYLQNLLRQSHEAAEGIDNELTDDFVKGLVQNLNKTH